MFDPKILKIEGEPLRVIQDLVSKVLEAAVSAAGEQILVAQKKGVHPQIFSAYLSSAGVRLTCMWAQQQIMLGMEDCRELPSLSQGEKDQLVQDVYLDMNTKMVALFNDRISRQS